MNTELVTFLFSMERIIKDKVASDLQTQAVQSGRLCNFVIARGSNFCSLSGSQEPLWCLMIRSKL